MTIRDTEMLRHVCQATLGALVACGTLQPPLEPAHLPNHTESDFPYLIASGFWNSIPTFEAPRVTMDAFRLHIVEFPLGR